MTVEGLMDLGKENSLWKLSTTSAKLLILESAGDDHPLVVLPMRDVCVAGSKLPGMKPTICLTNRKLIMVSHPGLFSSARCDSWLLAEIRSISLFHDRSFELSLLNGQTVKLRGMIGKGRVDAMTERLYETLKSILE